MCENCSPAVAGKYAELDAFIDGLKLDLADERRRGRLIQILHKAQAIFGYLPRSHFTTTTSARKKEVACRQPS